LNDNSKQASEKNSREARAKCRPIRGTDQEIIRAQNEEKLTGAVKD
jgi:hypothetical protein